MPPTIQNNQHIRLAGQAVLISGMGIGRGTPPGLQVCIQRLEVLIWHKEGPRGCFISISKWQWIQKACSHAAFCVRSDDEHGQKSVKGEGRTKDLVLQG